MNEVIIFFSIDILSILALVIVLKFILKKNPPEIMYSIMLSLAIPFIGVIISSFLFGIDKKNTILKSIHTDNIEKNKYEYLTPIDLKKEMDIIPVRDALILNNNKVKRNLLIRLIKKDTYKDIKNFKLASRDSDTETSHYAAAALIEYKRKLEQLILGYRESFSVKKNDMDYILIYKKHLKEYIIGDFVDEKNKIGLIKEHIKLLDIITKTNNRDIESFKEKINAELVLRDYSAAYETCYCFMEKNNDKEEPYLMLLKYYFNLKDIKSFKKLLEEFKNSNVELSNRGLNIIRHWEVKV